MDTREWFQRLLPLDLIAKRLQPPALLRFQNGKRLDYPVAQRAEEFRKTLLQELENIQPNCPSCAPCSTITKSFILPKRSRISETARPAIVQRAAHTHVREIISFAAYREGHDE